MQRRYIKALLIENCPCLERAIKYAYDRGKKIIKRDVSILYHVETPYGHVFLVGATSFGEVSKNDD